MEKIFSTTKEIKKGAYAPFQEAGYLMTISYDNRCILPDHASYRLSS
ncbi:hypothetical protein TDIS_1932 [Thermosulfurimonas dismutans]|uniref:Uncharacterized protein n=1 Tax=Thermosulfurimonas dismutans TaxID=999894 RepID=A0A179D1R6_9BACT|nr:hypothetical protein TDIS_1932 [Thermosulfurimonas dismutans]